MAFKVKHMVLAASLSSALLCLATACSARAAEPAMPCGGPSPVAGVEIRGPVLHVIDGESLCVALGFETDSWIRLRLADVPAATIRKTSTAGDESNPRGALMQVALARMTVCRTLKDETGQIAAVCEIDGKSIGTQLREPGVQAASYAWR